MIPLIVVALLAVLVLVSLAALAWTVACRRWDDRAEGARIDSEVRRAERQLHGLASQAFASMLDTARVHAQDVGK